MNDLPRRALRGRTIGCPSLPRVREYATLGYVVKRLFLSKQAGQAHARGDDEAVPALDQVVSPEQGTEWVEAFN